MKTKGQPGNRVPSGGGTRDADLLAVEERVKRLAETVQGAMQNRELLEVANRDDDLIALFNNTYEAHALKAIRFSLTQSLLMQVMRCWDRAREDRASLFRLAEILGKRGMAEAFEERAAGLNPTLGPHAADRDRALVRSRLPVLLDRIAQQAQGDTGQRMTRLRDYRDIFVAHNLIKLPASGPMYSDIFNMLSETTTLVQEAQLLCLGQVVDFVGTAEEYARQAKSFWNVLKAGQMANRQPDQPATLPS